MANIKPFGIDATPGQHRPLDSADTLTDAAGNPVGVTPAPAATVGLVPLQFGGTGIVAGEYFEVGSRYLSAAFGGLAPRNECIVPVTGTLKLLTWNRQTTAFTFTTASVVPWINGIAQTALSETFQGRTGTSVISIAVTAGDELAFELDSITGTWSNSVLTVYLEPSTGNAHGKFFGGNHPIVNYWLPSNMSPTSGQSALNSDASTRSVLLEACNLTTFSWNSLSGTASSDLEVYKNTVLQETLDLTGASGVITGFTTSFAAGDICEFKVTTQILGTFNAYAVFDTVETTVFGFAGDHTTTPGLYANYGSARGAAATSLTSTNYNRHFTGHITPNCQIVGFIMHATPGEREEDFVIYKNGIPVHAFSAIFTGSFPASQVSEPITFDTPISFSLGDHLSIADVWNGDLGNGQLDLLANVTL
jgi:hypothetical protein